MYDVFTWLIWKPLQFRQNWWYNIYIHKTYAVCVFTWLIWKLYSPDRKGDITYIYTKRTLYACLPGWYGYSPGRTGAWGWWQGASPQPRSASSVSRFHFGTPVEGALYWWTFWPCSLFPRRWGICMGCTQKYICQEKKNILKTFIAIAALKSE